MTLTCRVCGREFDRPHAKGPIPRYCSESHRQRAFVERKIAMWRERALKAEAELRSLRGSAPTEPCFGCGGSGWFREVEAVDLVNGPDFERRGERCPDCAGTGRHLVWDEDANEWVADEDTL